jgi:low affinity Fe/Cu permease
MFTRSRSAAEAVFARLAAQASVATGSFWAFSIALLVILSWAALGPIFHFSTDWQLVVNTGTTIVTFVMVFVIQHAQNKEMRAVQLKLDELIAASDGASNTLIDIENLTERELELLYRRFRRLSIASAKLAAGARTTVEDDRVGLDAAAQ